MGRKNITSFKSSFTPDGDRFSLLFPDGTVKVWSTGMGTLVAEWKNQDSDSSVEYSCISCSFVGKKRKKECRPFLLALGTSSGDVVAIDVATGARKWINSNCCPGGITTLIFANKGHALYAAGTDGEISKLNSETGESQGKFKASRRSITSLALSSDEKLLAVASDKTRVFSMDDKKELFKLSSDVGPFQSTAVSDNGKIVVSSMFGQKQIQLWSCNYENKSTTAEAIFALHDSPVLVDCKSHNNEEGITMFSVSEEGVAYVWHLMNISQDGVTPTKIMVKSAKTKKEQQKGNKNHIPIICGKLCNNGKDMPNSVLVAYGTLDNLRFRSLEVPGNGKDIFLRMEDDVPLCETEDASLEENMDPNSRGDAELQNPDSGTDVKIKKNTKKRKTLDLDSSNSGISFGAEESNELGGESDMNEPTMEEKLASLDLIDDDKAKPSTEHAPLPSVKPPSADSVHILLKQALHADDNALLLDCLYTRDEKVIAKSTSLLNPADVLKLLNSLVSMIQLRGAVLVCMLPWLRNLLSQHASSIASQESALIVLNSLYQLIESRISTFGSALQLSTCLDVLFARMPDDEVDDESTIPTIIYEDKDSEEEEYEEDAMETGDDSEDFGAVIDSPCDSDGSEVMSD